jgi:CheY-like chemotaxis protein
MEKNGIYAVNILPSPAVLSLYPPWKKENVDIYCLDIMMPGITGIDAAKEIRAYDKTAPIPVLKRIP